ncbi:methyltransferase [bacterium]|nr:methyltransferase [bacterium]
MGELIADLFSKNTKIVYKGLDFFWQDLHALWPPSVDSFYFLNNLMENINSLLGNKKQISSILDVGTGTGFLGIMLTHLFKDVKKLCLTDWTTTSYLYSSINYFINSQQHFQNRDISFQFKTAANTYWDNFGEMNSEDNKYDLVVCNPPYLPIPEKFSELRAENTTAGTELLEHIIEQSIGLGKMTIIQFSHIAKEIAEKVAIKCGRELQLIGKPKVIPFRIPRALENREYMEWLLDENATEKDTGWKLFSNDNIKDGIKRHRYYHQIQTYLIT